MSTLDWALTTQVSNTVLGDDDLHRVLAMIVVANHWQECGDSTTLSGRRSSVNPSSDYFASIKTHPTSSINESRGEKVKHSCLMFLRSPAKKHRQECLLK